MTTATVTDQSLHDLTEVLRQEERHYADLLTLAHTQGKLMTTHDLEGLEENARRMTEGLAAADEVRIRRERLSGDIMRRAGANVPGSLSAWLDSQPGTVSDQLADTVQTVRRTAGELARANEMNRRLANFCLDLVEEEAALLRRCLLEDPAGRYDSGAQPTCKEQGGVLQRQA